MLKINEDSKIERMLEEMHQIDVERGILKQLKTKFWNKYREVHDEYQLSVFGNFEKGYATAFDELIRGVFLEEINKVKEAWDLSREQLPTELKQLFPWDW